MLDDTNESFVIFFVDAMRLFVYIADMISMNVNELIRVYKDVRAMHKRVPGTFWPKVQLHLRNLSGEDFSKFVDSLAPSHLVAYRNYVRKEIDYGN